MKLHIYWQQLNICFVVDCQRISSEIPCIITTAIAAHTNQLCKSKNLKQMVYYVPSSRTLIIRISIIRTFCYPNAILNFKIPKDNLVFCKTK